MWNKVSCGAGLTLWAWAALLLACWVPPCCAEEAGLIVEAVAPGSPAAMAGIQTGDRLLAYDDRPLPSAEALQALQQNTFGKQEVALQLRHGAWRRGRSWCHSSGRG